MGRWSAAVRSFQRARGADARDGAVEASSTEGDSLPNVGKEEVALNVALERDLCERDASAARPRASDLLSFKLRLTQHSATDIEPNPVVPLFRQDLARKARPGPDVEQVRRPGLVLVVGRGWSVSERASV